jgi:DHA1 family bicyclomycin/chloramphenicol resistance-like MFS transporter
MMRRKSYEGRGHVNGQSPATAPPAEQKRYSWRMLALLSTLMGFCFHFNRSVTSCRCPCARRGHRPDRVDYLRLPCRLYRRSTLMGPIGDRHGQRIPIMAGLILFTIGSAGCALASGVYPLIVARLAQALGGSASVVLARAMVSDLYEGPAAARMISTLMTVMAVAPLLGPLVGG